MKLLLTMVLMCGSLLGQCKLAPDVCAWNVAMTDMHAYAEQEQVFAQAAQEWAQAKQAEIDDTGTISSEALKKFTAMWAAWQNLRAAFKKAEKSFHDFSVVEMNK